VAAVLPVAAESWMNGICTVSHVLTGMHNLSCGDYRSGKIKRHPHAPNASRCRRSLVYSEARTRGDFAGSYVPLQNLESSGLLVHTWV